MALDEIQLETGYSSGPEDLLRSFYRPCLQSATEYDRAVGYFRSSLFVVAGVAFSDFANRGGRMRLICSPRLTRQDLEAIQRGLSVRSALEGRINEEFDEILQAPANVPAVEFLATLVCAGVLEVRLAFKANDLGLYHNKVGIFTDDESNQVTFLGTANETLSAWCSERNHEGLEVFRSWNTSDSSRVDRHTKYFEDLWNNSHSELEVLELSEVAEHRLSQHEVEEGLDEAAARVRNQLENGPGYRGGGLAQNVDFQLMEHQKESVEAWFDNGCKGIIKHATGAGKTITALEIVRRWQEEGRPALIVAPTTVLIQQWIEEASAYLGESVSILQAGGGQARRKWEDALPSYTSGDPTFGDRITIASLATARTTGFRDRCVQGDHLLVVADEVHTVGSQENRKLCRIDAGGRLGLSATPERYGDPEGTSRLFEYFGEIVEPVIGLADAIESGRLVPYDYYPHQVALSVTEQQRWDDLTTKIQRQYASLPEDAGGNKIHTDRFTHLLIQRASILKQAEAKVDLAARVLRENYDEDERWLVYCDNREQLEKVSGSLRSEGLPTLEYHSAMDGSRDATMRYFEDRPSIMVAIKCLDEGVDIPSANCALILASSSNPREFIQRRGRVLRSASGKHAAGIHDALVVPSDNGDGETKRPILRTELSRAARFASTARNSAALFRLRQLAKSADLDIDQLQIEAYEKEEEHG